MKRSRSLIWTTAFILAAAWNFLATSIHATIVQGDSGGVVTSISLGIAGVAGASVIFGNLDSSSPPPYNDMITVIDLDSDFSGGGIDLYAQTGTGEIFASSTVDGNAGSREAGANATVFDSFSFSAVSIPAAPPLVSVSSTSLIASTADVTGSSALDIVSTGDSDLLGLTIAVNGVPLVLGAIVDGNAPPNTPLASGVTGLTITLNEQIDIGNNVTDFGIQVSAIHLAFNGVNVGLTSTVNGDVYISRSYSLMTIPEPSPFLLLGWPILCTLLRRRR